MGDVADDARVGDRGEDLGLVLEARRIAAGRREEQLQRDQPAALEVGGAEDGPHASRTRQRFEAESTRHDVPDFHENASSSTRAASSSVPTLRPGRAASSQ